MTGALIGRGRGADVFDAGPGLVLRRYRTEQDCTEEAAVMQHLARHGYPVPRVEHATGRDIVMERIDGPTMLADASTHPWRLRRHARTLADLHRRLAGVPAPDVLTRRVEGAPDGDGVLHLDLHPDNVLMGPNGPVVIDWTNACRGDPRLEVANTWMVMATGELPNSGPARLVARVGRRAFVSGFLAGHDRRSLRAVLPPLVARRLTDPNMSEQEKERIRSMSAG